MKTVKYYIATSVLIACLLASSAYSQGFWYGADITDGVLSEEQANALHNFLTGQDDPSTPEIEGLNIGRTMFGMTRLQNQQPSEPNGVRIYKPDKTWDGCTLLSLRGTYRPDPSGPPHRAVLIDMNGNVVNSWPIEWAYPALLLPNGSVMGGLGAMAELTGIPNLVQMSWTGEEEWRWSGNSNDVWYTEAEWPSLDPDEPNEPIGTPKVSGQHHDYQREGNPVGYYVPGQEAIPYGGKTLILCHHIPGSELTQHISDYRLYDEAIYEVDWEGNILFAWYAYLHYDQIGYEEDAKLAVKTSRSGAPNLENATDYLHLNTVNYLGPNKWYDDGDLRFHPENIITDSRSSNFIAMIARYDHPNGQWKSGDIIWKIGPNYSTDYPEAKLGQIIGLHHAHMIPKGLPGEGNILVFDNGGGAGFGPLIAGLTPISGNTYRNYSRVIEFNPITLEMVWEYKQSNPTADYDGDGQILGNERKLFSFFISGAQRLQNGNTLITEGQAGRLLEVTPDNEVVWEYYSDFGFGFNGSVYRAYRYPDSWIPDEMEN